jgi:glycosyltransferase involved in cell wall biosynthesis
MPNKLISCVISCYNEEKNIAILLDQIKSNNLEKNFEFIIVNNGSTDNSWQIICEKKNNFPEIIFINLDKDLGWGNGITEGLKLTSCEYVGWTHGDLQYDLKILLQVQKVLKDPNNRGDSILIKGRRKNRKFIEVIFTFMMSIIASILLGKILYDINAQPNFFSRKVLNDFKNTPKDLMLDFYLYYKILKKKNNKIIRIPVMQEERIHGFSSWNRSFISKFMMSVKQFIGIIKVRF